MTFDAKHRDNKTFICLPCLVIRSVCFLCYVLNTYIQHFIYLWAYNFLIESFVSKFGNDNCLNCNFHKCIGERPLMTSHVFWSFLTYLPILSYSITSDFGGYLGPPTYPKIGRHLWTFPCRLFFSFKHFLYYRKTW